MFPIMNETEVCQFSTAQSFKLKKNSKLVSVKFVRLSLSFCFLLISCKLSISMSLVDFFNSSYEIHNEFKIFIWLWSFKTLVLSPSANKEYFWFSLKDCVLILQELNHWCTWFSLLQVQVILLLTWWALKAFRTLQN